MTARSWTKLEFPAIMPGPEARSACQLAALQGGALVFGGYSRVRVKGERFSGKVGGLSDIEGLLQEMRRGVA